MQPVQNMNRSIYQVESLQPFQNCLTQQGLCLTRGECTTLQVNVGLLCNQSCKHCHLDAGPTRNEVMTEKTVMDVIVITSYSIHYTKLYDTRRRPECFHNPA